MLKTSSNTFYIGQTNNLARRMAQHASGGGKAAKYMRYHSGFQLVFTKQCSTRSEAMKLEARLKKLKRPQKEKLCQDSPIA